MPRTSSNSTPGLQLVEYSPRTFRAAGKKAELVPFILVSRTGRISFNRKAVELMGAGERECAVTLLQDSRRPRDWYMRPGEGGFPLPDVPAHGPCGEDPGLALVRRGEAPDPDSRSYPPRRIIYVIDGGGRQECRNR